MKKITYLLLILLGSSISSNSQEVQKEKTYTIVLTTQQLQALYSIIDISTAPHTTVLSMEKLITEQFQSPQNTVKIDSTKSDKKYK